MLICWQLLFSGDSNKGRRDAVRRKTAQYLMKAEDLFNRHLSTEKVDERRWGVSIVNHLYIFTRG